jgi:hypothetical protein
MSNPYRARRVSVLNETEAAGANQEVWVDFDWAGVAASNRTGIAACALRHQGVVPHKVAF